MSIDPVLTGLDASEAFLDSVHDLIGAQILGSFPDLIPGVDAIARQLDNLVTKSETAIENATTAIKTQIEPLIKSAVPDALAFVAAITSSLDTHLAQLMANIATTEDVFSAASSAIQRDAPRLSGWIGEVLGAGFGGAILGALKEMETQDRGGIDATLDHVLSLPGIPLHLEELAKNLRNRGAEWQALALPALLVGVLLGAIEASQEPFSTIVRQTAYERLPTKVTPVETMIDLLNKGMVTSEQAYREARSSGFDVDPVSRMIAAQQERLAPRDAAEMFFRGILERGEALAEMRKHGLTDGYAQWMLTLSERLIPEDTIRQAFLRDYLTADQHDFRLFQWGYTPERAELMRKLYFFIPPVQDLIHMAIRNVFTPAIVERFELFGDFPEAFKNAARQQGISEEWALKYWGAHWIVPSNTEGFEMFQRTTDAELDPDADSIELLDGTHVHNIIGRSTLRLLLREKDIAPFYRDKLTQLAYRPITRIDIRRLHKVGLLSKAGVQRAYLDLGYSPANALKLAEFVEKLNAAAAKDAASAITTTLRHKILGLYVADKLGADDVKSTLADLGFSDAEIGVWLAEADLDHEAQYITAIEAGIGKLYVAGLITDKEAIKRMEAGKVPRDAQRTLFAKWDLAIEYKGGSEHIHKHRELTKTEVLESLIDGMIDETIAEGMLIDLGYDKTGADAEIGLALYRQLKTQRKIQTDAIKAMYVNGIRELLETSNALDSMRVPSDQRDAYLAEWTLARETRTERIPIATLRDMVRKSGFMDDVTAFAHLKRHRFTDDDATLLLRFWHGA